MIPEDESFEDKFASKQFFTQFSGKNVNPFKHKGEDGLEPEDKDKE